MYLMLVIAVRIIVMKEMRWKLRGEWTLLNETEINYEVSAGTWLRTSFYCNIVEQIGVKNDPARVVFLEMLILEVRMTTIRAIKQNNTKSK